MKKDDSILREILQRKIAQINTLAKTVLIDVEKYMADKFNVRFSTTVDIFNGLIPIESLPYHMLYKLMVSIHNTNIERYVDLDVSELNPSIYFTDEEINESKQPIEYDNEEKDIVISNWLQVNPDQWVCVIPIEQLIEWRNLNKIRYNPKTQRSLTIKESKGVVTKVITLVQKSLKEIYSLMVNNEFISDDITLNINPDLYKEPFIIHGNLIISKESQIDIIDGFHRLLKMWDVKEKDTNWKYNCIVNVMSFNEDKANRYILQKDKKNHLTEEQTAKLDKNSESNYVLTRLNEDGFFYLKGTITGKKFVLLKRIIDQLFELKDKRQSFRLYDYIKNNLNTLIENNDYFNRDMTHNEWYIYLYVMKYCIENELDFISVISKFDIDKLLKQINIKNSPLKRHKVLLDERLSEVKKNE